MPPENDRDNLEPDAGSAGEWDIASDARRVANDDARRLKRAVRSKRTRKQNPDWDASAEQAPPSEDTNLDQKLAEIEKRFKSQEARPSSRRSKSSRKRSALVRRAKKVGVVLLSLVGGGLIIYMAIVAIKPPAERTTSGLPSPSELEVLPSLLPKDPLASEPETPKNYTIVYSDEPHFDPVKETISEFLTTQSIDKRLTLVRPTLDVRRHLEESKEHPLLTLGLAPNYGSAFIISGDFVYAEIIEAGIGIRGAILEKVDDRYLLDFDSLIGYSDVDWEAVSKMEIDAPVTTRALIKIVPNGNSPVPGTEVAFVTDPNQNTSFPAAVAVLDIEDEHILGALSTGQLLPFVVTLSRAEYDGSPLLMMDEIVFSGWFEKNLFR